MTEKTVPKTRVAKSSTTITLTQEQYEAVLQRQEALEALLQRQENTFWRLHVVPIMGLLWQCRWAWFVAGVLLTAVVLPNFPQGSWTVFFQKISTNSPSEIAKAAPNKTDLDKAKRKTLVKVCQKTVESIRAKTVTTRSDALTELASGLISLQTGKWELVIDALDVYLLKANDLDALADRLEKLTQAFLD
jgi:hypothetical protein